MAKKNKELFKGGGGSINASSSDSNNDEIKIAILLNFYNDVIHIEYLSGILQELSLKILRINALSQKKLLIYY